MKIQCVCVLVRCGGQVHHRMPWTDLLVVLAPSELVAKLQGYWTAIGIVAALVGTMAYQAMFVSVQPHPMYDNYVSDLLKKWFAFLMGVAFVFSIVAVLLVTLFYAQLNQLPRDCDM